MHARLSTLTTVRLLSATKSGVLIFSNRSGITGSFAILISTKTKMAVQNAKESKRPQTSGWLRGRSEAERKERERRREETARTSVREPR